MSYGADQDDSYFFSALQLPPMTLFPIYLQQ